MRPPHLASEGDRPSGREATAYYLAGSILMSVITGVIVLVALRAGNLSRPGERAPRYGLRLGLGILALAAGAFIGIRKPAPSDPDKPGKGIVSRMLR